MIRTILLTLFLFLATGTMSELYSQSWLEHVGRTAARRAKDRAVQRVEDKVYQKVDNAGDFNDVFTKIHH